MGFHSFLRSPKREEQQVPDTEFCDIQETNYADEDVDDFMDELEGFLGIEDEEQLSEDNDDINVYNDHFNNWDFMEWDEYLDGDEGGENKHKVSSKHSSRSTTTECFEDYSKAVAAVIKKETTFGFWDEEEDKKKVSLNLNLNLKYQEVLDAWSDRGTLWADDDSSLVMMANNGYKGEVPVMEEEKSRREASVLRYKEKRQSRLFSKKIRYQVRKLNADKRPRLKGRFVKRVVVPEKILK